MRKSIIFAFSLIIFLLAGCTIDPSQLQQKPPEPYKCPNGELASDLASCTPVVVVEGVNVTLTNETAEDVQPETTTPEQKPPAPKPPVQPEQPPINAAPPEPAVVCGDGKCAGNDANETFGQCPQDCPLTYSYLYEYTDGFSYYYDECTQVNNAPKLCDEKQIFVEPGEPVYDPVEKMKARYNRLNSYTLSIKNRTDTIKVWVNSTSSECLYQREFATMLDIVFNCSSITSIGQIGTETVEVPIGIFTAQKFEITFVQNPITYKGETMTVWKVRGPLTGYPFMAKSNIRVPVKTEREWTYITADGMPMQVKVTQELKAYIEPYYG
ncbi:MAG: hypothetical protein Q7T16_04760 [Candidatus Burarchaeum sp.]|nr:hypothetical protein [Candidatus Burarchaeum sp.]MDO8339940.1 hypothetical protein [Candidatus Burarchaeum sp.]